MKDTTFIDIDLLDELESDFVKVIPQKNVKYHFSYEGKTVVARPVPKLIDKEKGTCFTCMDCALYNLIDKRLCNYFLCERSEAGFPLKDSIIYEEIKS